MKAIIVVENGSVGTRGLMCQIDNITIPETVPLTKEFNSNVVIGEVKVFKEHGVLKAEIDVPESSFQHCYPAIGVKNVEQHVDEKGVTVITQCDLFCVALSHSPNQDTTIKTLFEQMKSNVTPEKP